MAPVIALSWRQGAGRALSARERDIARLQRPRDGPLQSFAKLVEIPPDFILRFLQSIFLDPPYDTDLAEKTLETVAEHEIDWGESILAAQTNRKRNLDLLYGPWRLRKHYPHGDSALWIYEPNNPVN